MIERIGHLLLAALLLVCFASALGVVHIKYRERRLVTELSELRESRDRLDSEWSRLLLEEATLTTHARVEGKARDELGMVLPQPQEMAQVRR
ncbi:MAG: cell division protein FtsL [Immundisolibacter sp.]|jgi:cell division protein FtsL|uniref:cell division protein FtsL n=1 Tax=Immundisolibacter sp. TaxID=1934948 RepID=UPI001988D082|nr:cell division protein FtsL [Immundisolibacter sp.]MBC7160644.1 cell division protein FtsL [Immundisolibacter sp.]